MHKKIINLLKERSDPLTQMEVSNALPDVNRAILLGYLRCLVDMGKIKSKNSGKAKIYYL
jgi:hypothetical protein